MHFTQGLGRPDQSVVYYSADRITANVPFPPDAADIIFDQHRPYLGCIAPAAFDATVNFFRKEMQAIGWKPLVRCRRRSTLVERQVQRDDRERRAYLLHT